VPISVVGLTPMRAHNAIKTAIAAIPGASARLAVINAHPPATNRPAAGIGGVYLCGACSPGLSRVAWACPPYRAACGEDIIGLGG
jgi:hypothetical protein